MIVLNCIRVRRLMEEKELTIENLSTRFILNTHDVYNRLNSIGHSSYIKNIYNDDFVYELSRELDCSVDYLLGWSDDRGKYIEFDVKDKKSKEKELTRVTLKYCNRYNVPVNNTNILANRTGIDREVFDYLYSETYTGSSWLCTSFYITSHMSVTYGFNYLNALNLLFDVEDDDSSEENNKRKEIVEYYMSLYNQAYNH